jgi:hypothetical protein
MIHEANVSGNPPSEMNRRTKIRFPLNSEVRYQLIRRGQGRVIEGSGWAEDISSKGLAFRTGSPLSLGAHLSVSMLWPVLLDERCHLRLFMEGSVVRVEGDLVVTSIDSYEFRTSGRAAESAAEALAGAIRGAEEVLREQL